MDLQRGKERDDCTDDARPADKVAEMMRVELESSLGAVRSVKQLLRGLRAETATPTERRRSLGPEISGRNCGASGGQQEGLKSRSSSISRQWNLLHQEVRDALKDVSALRASLDGIRARREEPGSGTLIACFLLAVAVAVVGVSLLLVRVGWLERPFT